MESNTMQDVDKTNNLDEIDSSIDLQTKQNLSSTTTEALYRKILYGIVHKVNCDHENDTILYSYMQAAFNVENALHEELLAAVSEMAPPHFVLNVDVINGKRLKPKRTNGSTNPYAVVYLSSSPSNYCSTSIKSTTNPVWDEQFRLPLINRTDDENLIVELWDLRTPGMLVKQSSKTLTGSRFITNLMKDLTLGRASEENHDNELIGRCTIPLKTIPAPGLCASFALQRNDKPKERGTIELQLSFQKSVNHTKFTPIEYNDLIRIILLHELRTSKPAQRSGEFSDSAEAIITLGEITSKSPALDRWIAFTSIYSEHAFSLRLFVHQLNELLLFLRSEQANAMQIQAFWNGAKKLLPSCFYVIRNIPKAIENDNQFGELLVQSLSIISIIARLTPPTDVDLYPRQIYGWLGNGDDNNSSVDVFSVVQEAISARARDFLNQIQEFRSIHQENDMNNLQNMIKVMRFIRADLQHGSANYDGLFKEKVSCDYTSICYTYYENAVVESYQMAIERACKHLQQMPDADQNDNDDETSKEALATALFDLYLILKDFAGQSTNFGSQSNMFRVSEFHEWFMSGVTCWLDMHHFNALKRIQKAIELDTMGPVDEMARHSTSAVDAFAIFYPIKDFWLQLNWPDAESGYTFMARIVDDICRCCEFYVRTIFERIQLFERENNSAFDVVAGGCFAINNIDFMLMNLPTLIEQINADAIIVKIAEYRSQIDAKRCQDTLKNFIANAMDTKQSKINELIVLIARTICATVNKCMTEVAENQTKDSSRSMQYVEQSLITCNTTLNGEYFESITSITWRDISNSIDHLVQNNICMRRSPQVFGKLLECLRTIINSFSCNGTALDSIETEKIIETEHLLELHSYDTSYLIHQYYFERYQQQLAMSDTPYGQLTIRANLINEHYLELEVLNARNLMPATSGSCHPFIKIQIISIGGRASDKFRTNAQSKTLFPIFDEKFMISLSTRQTSDENCLIMFSVNDENRFGRNKHMAECFITLKEIANANECEQIHLTLSRHTTSLDSEQVEILRVRQDDQTAKKFIKKIKHRFSTS